MVSSAVLVSRLILAAVLSLAAVAKLADRAGGRRALEQWGAPRAALLAVVLPLLELAVAAALIPPSTAVVGAIAALGLLLAFTAAIAVMMARGRSPDCHCFGALHSAPTGWRTLARNGVLAALATFVAIAGVDDPGPSAVGWISDVSHEQVTLLVGAALLVAVAVLAWFSCHLFAQQGRLLSRLDAVEHVLAGTPTAARHPGQPTASALAGHGPAPGTPAPAFDLPSVEGIRVTLEALAGANRPVVLVFADHRCESCTDLMPDIGRWQHDLIDTLRVVLISRHGSVDARLAPQLAPEHCLLDDNGSVAKAYSVAGTPSAVLVRPDGAIGWAAQGAAEIRSLLASTVRTPALSVVARPGLNGVGDGGGNVPALDRG